MNQGGYVTVIGYVARDPIIRQTKQGTNVTEVRVGTTARFLDRTTGQWRDGETNYFTVKCWRRLADHTKASLHKGEPVMVRGRLRTRSYEDKAGQIKTLVEIEADAIGHDLSRGISNYIRTRTPADTADGQAAGVIHDGESPEHVPDRDILDEEAIAQFERDLAAQALDEREREREHAAQAPDHDDNEDEDEDERAAQALDEGDADDEGDEGDEDDEREAAEAARPGASVPF